VDAHRARKATTDRILTMLKAALNRALSAILRHKSPRGRSLTYSEVKPWDSDSIKRPDCSEARDRRGTSARMGALAQEQSQIITGVIGRPTPKAPPALVKASPPWRTRRTTCRRRRRLISAAVDTEGNDRCLATCRRNFSVMN
jgi:hypothetical protein